MLRSMKRGLPFVARAVQQQLDDQHDAIGAQRRRGTGQDRDALVVRPVVEDPLHQVAVGRRHRLEEGPARAPTSGPPGPAVASVATTCGWSNTVAGQVRAAGAAPPPAASPGRLRRRRRECAAPKSYDAATASTDERADARSSGRRSCALRSGARPGAPRRRCRGARVNAVSPVRTLWARLPHAAQTAGSAWSFAWGASEAGASERRGRPSSVSAKLSPRPPSSTPTVASARNSRWVASGCVPVAAATSADGARTVGQRRRGCRARHGCRDRGSRSMTDDRAGCSCSRLSIAGSSHPHRGLGSGQHGRGHLATAGAIRPRRPR